MDPQRTRMNEPFQPSDNPGVLLIAGDPQRSLTFQAMTPPPVPAIDTGVAPHPLTQAVLLIGGDGKPLLEAVRELRASPLWCLMPVYLETGVARRGSALLAELDCLVDGRVSSTGQALELAQLLREAGEELATDAGTEADERLLCFLFGRPDRIISPLKDPQSPELYRYPLVEALCGTADSHAMVNSLLARGVIERQRLVERLRLCPDCAGAHLVYVDTCPSCTGMELQRDEAVHCFTCGHVATQRSFLSSGTLNCPKCRSRLRHIGVDYDRPLENHLCGDCGELFAEPEVLARCVYCDHAASPVDLVSREIGEFRLTDHGRMVARHGDGGDLGQVLDSINYLRVPVFELFLDWQLAVNQRYQPCHCVLVALRLSNLRVLAERHGRARLGMLMQEFAERLQALVRKTDVCTRTSEQDFWILLPQTDEKGGEVFAARLQHLVEDSRQEGGYGLNMAVALEHAGAVQTGENSGLLMSRLRGALDDAGGD